MTNETAAVVPISTEFIRLDSAMKLAGAVYSGGEAKLCIQEGMVSVNGEICLQRGRKLHPGDCFVIDGAAYEVTRA